MELKLELTSLNAESEEGSEPLHSSLKFENLKMEKCHYGELLDREAVFRKLLSISEENDLRQIFIQSKQH